MSTVAEIESALEQLPTEQMLAVAAWLDKRRAMLGLDLDAAEQAELRQALDDSLARRHEAFTPLDAL
jgi:hypothetical protein